MMIVAPLSRANDKAEAGLREDSYHETPINGGRDRHPEPGLLLVVTLHLHHPFLPSATASGHSTTRGPSDPARALQTVLRRSLYRRLEESDG
jgi:hypothetical protein